MKNVKEVKEVKEVTVKQLDKMDSKELKDYINALSPDSIVSLKDDVFQYLFQNVQIEQTSVNTSNRKASIHKYTEDIINESDILRKQGLMKQHRQRIRKQLERFVKGYSNNVNPIAKIKFLKENKFITFYKENFILNDYSIESICASHKEGEKKKELIDLMNFVKCYKTKI